MQRCVPFSGRVGAERRDVGCQYAEAGELLWKPRRDVPAVRAAQLRAGRQGPRNQGARSVSLQRVCSRCETRSCVKASVAVSVPPTSRSSPRLSGFRGNALFRLSWTNVCVKLKNDE